MKKIIIVAIVLITLYSCSNQNVNPANNIIGTNIDIDGNIYDTVVIGTQVWMVQNLKVTHYNDGTPIQNIKDNIQWYKTRSGAYCFYNNNSNNIELYGNIYNGYAVHSNKLAPKGWRIPSDYDWGVLNDYLSTHGSGIIGVGDKLKSTSNLWRRLDPMPPYLHLDNSSGFSALPGGYRSDGDGGFKKINEMAFFWGSLLNGSCGANCARVLEYDDNDINYFGNNKEAIGFSVRCVKFK